MKYPIFVVDNGDIILFYSVGDLERFLEPWAIEEDLKVFDSEGRKIDLIVQHRGDLRNERVVFHGIENDPKHPNDLREGIVLYLKHLGIEEGWLSTAGLDDLVMKIQKYYGHDKKFEGLITHIRKFLGKYR